MLFRVKHYLPILLASIILCYFAFDYLEIEFNLRMSFLNLIKGIFCSIFAFILVTLTHAILLLSFKQKYLESFQSFFKLTKQVRINRTEIINKALFHCAFEELIFRVLIFSLFLKYSNFYLASFATCILVYCSYLLKGNYLPAILLVSYSFFANKLYYIHESYFLCATSNFFFWLSWLFFVSSEHLDTTNEKILRFRKKWIK